MSEKYGLEGQYVLVYLEGGWEFSGEVEFVSEDKVVLSSESGPIVLYKSKIVAAMIILEENVDVVIQKPKRITESNTQLERVEFDYSEELDHYGSIIPEDMLSGEADKTQVSFSMNMSDFKNPKQKEDKYGSSKKNRTNGKKDSK